MILEHAELAIVYKAIGLKGVVQLIHSGIAVPSTLFYFILLVIIRHKFSAKAMNIF
jgi:hypothetical protein